MLTAETKPRIGSRSHLAGVQVPPKLMQSIWTIAVVILPSL
jgi:hypothetical protein